MKRVFKWTAIVLGILLVVAVVALGIFFRDALYDHFSTFPNQARAWDALRKERKDLTPVNGWHEFRGIMHSHSECSHDSKIPFPEILAALKIAKSDFIFMSDHPVNGKGDYSIQWKGLHDGVLFIRGFELDNGFLPWGIPDGTILDDTGDPYALGKQIKDLGGIVCFAHCEEPRPWDMPELTGMEIYNTHWDLIKVQRNKQTLKLAKEFLINYWAYPDQTFRTFSTREDDYISRWDELNLTRHITGIAGNDIHQNVGIVIYVTDQGEFAIRDTGHLDRNFVKFKPGLSRPFLWLLFGPLTPKRQLFRFDADPYQRSARYVGTHLLAKELTEASLVDAVRAGRAFVAFDMIVDAHGFSFWAENSKQKVVMGESIAFEPGMKLKVESPVPCEFTLYQNGIKGPQGKGREWEYVPTEPGKYRIEATLDILGQATPWVYTNPIEVSTK